MRIRVETTALRCDDCDADAADGYRLTTRRWTRTVVLCRVCAGMNLRAALTVLRERDER